MMKVTAAAQFSYAIFITSVLSACGGGGGGSAATTPANNVAVVEAADGLGISGHLPGTVEIGGGLLPEDMLGHPPQVAVALSDEGRALAAWQFYGYVKSTDNFAAWTQSSAAGVWQAAAALPQAAGAKERFGAVLRMNEAGNAVLGWMNNGPEIGPRVVRFIQGAGWEQASYNPGTAIIGNIENIGSTWDVSLLADNSTSYSGFASDSFAVAQTSMKGQQNIVLETEKNHDVMDGTTMRHNGFYNGSWRFSFFAPRPNGDGLFYYTTSSYGKPMVETTLNAQIASLNGAGLGSFEIGTYENLCVTEHRDSPIVAVTTAHTEGVLAVLSSAQQSFCTVQNLELVRVYTQNAIRIEKKQLNTEGTYLPYAPVLAVDQAGNALVVWMEVAQHRAPEGNQIVDSVRLMWSQSMYGGAWSTPQPLIFNVESFGAISTDNQISVAMNAAGQAAASIRIVNGRDPKIVVSRFSFKGGWETWKAVANKQALSQPKVAINASGQAVLAYSAYDAIRENGHVPDFYGPDSSSSPTAKIRARQRVFALQF